MLDEAYRLHRDRVLVWATLRGVPEADLEDVAHEVFRVFGESGAQVPRGAVPAWLRAATANIARRHRARLLRRSSRELDIEEEHVSPAAPPELLVGDGQVRAELLGLVARLERTRREVLTRHVLDEEPIDAIAAAQGVPVETAKKRLRLARRDLRAAIERARARERRTAGTVSFGMMLALLDRRAVRIGAAIVGLGGALVGAVALLRGPAPELAPSDIDAPPREALAERWPVVQPFVRAPSSQAGEARAVGVVDARSSARREEYSEVELLSIARRAMREGSPVRALEYLDRHRRLYPHGSLAPEREVLRARWTAR